MFRALFGNNKQPAARTIDNMEAEFEEEKKQQTQADLDLVE